MLIEESKNPEEMHIIEKYRKSHDTFYFDGKNDVYLEVTENLLANGVDEEIICECTCSVEQFNEIRKNFKSYLI